MVIIDVDHPDVEAFIDWKVEEEQKVASLVTGSKVTAKHLKAITEAAHGHIRAISRIGSTLPRTPS